MKPIQLLLTIFLLLSASFSFSQWTQQGADINGEAANDQSGVSVSLSANGARMAIGAPLNDGNGADSGHVRIFQWNGAAWAQLGTDINGEAADDYSGYSVSLSADGSRVAIGARYNDGNGADSGHVRIYQWNGVVWTQLGADINGEAAGDQSGWSVNLNADGSRIVIGALVNDGNGADSGHARIYEWNGATWVQMGADINGEGAGDYCGFSVSLSADGSRVAIGAPFNDGTGANSGHTRIFQWNGAAWVQLGVDINGEAAGDQAGVSVSLSADGVRIAIGANWNDGNGVDSGHVRIYQWNGAAWVQLGADINGEAANDWSGYPVSLSADGARLIIGGYLNDGNGANSGHARIYQWQGGAWVQLGTDLNGEAANDNSGYSVSLSGDGSRVAIGAIYNDGNGVDSGHLRLYRYPAPNSALGAGSGANSTGDANVFLGYLAGYTTTTGSSNTFVGSQSGYSNTTGSGNLFLGNRSGYSETGSNRLYVDNSDTATPLLWGDFANNILNFNANVGINTTSPTAALDVNGAARIRTINNNNTLTRVLVSDVSGNISYRDDTTLGDAHTFPSYPASAGDGGGNTNSFFGHLTGAVTTGANNTLVGFQSGLVNTTGYDNSSLGSQTLEHNTTGFRNTANGVYTLNWNTTGDENTAVGYAALGFNSIGSDNTAVGYLAMRGNFSPALNTGNGNTATGYQAMLVNESGTGNTVMGRDALSANTIGNNNVAIGREASLYNVTGSENVAIGYNSGATFGNTALNNTIAIGSNVAVTSSNQVRIGNFEVEDMGGVATWTVVSDGRFKINIAEDVAGLDFIKELRPVSYNLDRRKIRSFTGNTNATNSDVSKKMVGFIAQEVEQVVGKNGYVFSGVKTPENENDYYGLKYSEFVVPLTKAVQELSALVETQKQENQTLRQELETLKNAVYGATVKTAGSKSSGEETQLIAEGFALYQNVPNPFDRTTVIGAQLPESVQQAKIVVYNLQGLELASYPLQERGKVSVEISGGRLPSGMYLYALVADGQVIDTKKMILTN